MKRKQSHIQSQAKHQALTKIEGVLMQWITCITKIQYLSEYLFVREIVEFMHKWHFQWINDSSIQFISYSSQDKDWIQRFIRHNSKLQSIFATSIEASCIQESLENAFKSWFDPFKYEISEYNDHQREYEYYKFIFWI